MTSSAEDVPGTCTVCAQTMEAFTWRNFVRRKDGPAADRRLFLALLIVLVLEVIYLVAWILGWVAGGYMSTLSAVVSFFVHFAGFYAIWQRSPGGILAYAIVVSALIALYLANVVLVILTLTWNGSFFYDANGTNGGNGEPTVSPVPAAFMLLGVVGSANAPVALYYTMLGGNIVVVVLLTFLDVLLYSSHRLLSDHTIRLMEDDVPTYSGGGHPTALYGPRGAAPGDPFAEVVSMESLGDTTVLGLQTTSTAAAVPPPAPRSISTLGIRWEQAPPDKATEGAWTDVPLAAYDGGASRLSPPATSADSAVARTTMHDEPWAPSDTESARSVPTFFPMLKPPPAQAAAKLADDADLAALSGGERVVDGTSIEEALSAAGTNGPGELGQPSHAELTREDGNSEDLSTLHLHVRL